MSARRRWVLAASVALMLTGPMVAALVIGYAHIHERPCYDAILLEQEASTHVECPHPRHTLIRDTQWRCACPNTMRGDP